MLQITSLKKIIKHPAYQTLLHILALTGLTFIGVFFGIQYGITNVRGTIAERNSSFFSSTTKQSDTSTGTPIDTPPPKEYSCPSKQDKCNWASTTQWQVIKGGLTKDKEIIDRVSEETGVSSRLIVAVTTPEQLRFFTSEREVFKRYFEPLKILGSLTKFSLGVTGIKIDTAVEALGYAASSTSARYPGDTVAQLVSSTSKEFAYQGLTDEKNHYYAYLYTALIIKELQEEWRKAGFPLDNDSGVIVTLFNIGFDKSHPHANPQTGGAVITVGGTPYSYGKIGELFYESDELIDVFPK